MEEQDKIVIYESEDGQAAIGVRVDLDTVWLSLNQITELFQRDKSVVSRHISNVFKDGELDRKATVANYATIQNEGGREVSREIEYYNLDVITSVGYRVKSNGVPNSEFGPPKC